VLAGFIARCFRLPQGVTDVPVHVVIEQDETGAEAWARVWPGVIMRPVRATAVSKSISAPLPFAYSLTGIATAST
jgi:hypothetical protein